MFSIEKSYHFEAAHRLADHDGKCANFHGHSYKVDVRVETVSLIHNYGASNDSMVMDFAVLDEIMDPIIDQMDHHFIIPESERDDYLEVLNTTQTGKLDWLVAIQESLCSLPVPRTTAEELASFFVQQIIPLLSGLVPATVSATVWETAKGRGSYTANT